MNLLAQDGGGGLARLTAERMPALGNLLPELFLCGMVVLILIVDLVRGRGRSELYPRISLAGIAIAMFLVAIGPTADGTVGYDAFGSMRIDDLGRLFKLLFLATGFLTVLFIGRSRESYGNEAELHVLLFGALAGMCYLASATDIVSFYLAFETVSYTGYLMAGYRLENAKSAEAGGKYVIFGSVASAVMLFGLSLVYGFTGSTQFGEIGAAIAGAESQPALLVAAVLVFGGFAFKAAAFPFQFWCPDVYEGAPAPIAGFLAVGSKAAVFAVGVRILLGPGVITPESPAVSQLFAPDASFVQMILIVASVATMTWGNLAALRQTNVQRMLAYSSIAHAGYLLMTAAVVIPGTPSAQDAVGAIGFYFIVYLCMNLGAFFVVALMRRDTGSAELSSLRGAGFRHPVLALCFAIMLFSLTGLPPTAGFVGKFQLFAPVLDRGFLLLAVVGLLNGAVSLYYYAKPLREMFFAVDDPAQPSRLRPAPADLALLGLLTVPLVVLGLFGWDKVTDLTRAAWVVR